MRGKYIVFEGLDLSGKTYIINKIKKYKNEYIYMKEPGGLNNSSKIRDLILDDKYDPLVYSYLFAADRLNNLPAMLKLLNKNKTIISDRSYLTSLYYQGVLEDVKDYNVININKYFINSIKIDKIFYIMTDKDTLLKRYEKRNKLNYLDNFVKQYDYDKSNAMYIKTIRKNVSAPMYIIDTSKEDLSKLIKKIINIIEKENKL